MDPDLAELSRRFDTMPERERAVFARARFRAMDYLAIAADLGMTVAEVEQLMARAMLHLLGHAPADIEQPLSHG